VVRPKPATTCQLARMCLADRRPDARTGALTARLEACRSRKLRMAASLERRGADRSLLFKA
jgi:hypothetical protein